VQVQVGIGGIKVGIGFGGMMLALEKVGKSKINFGASERVLIKECLEWQFPTAHFVGARSGGRGRWGS
jgi:hypothetical protein